MKSFIFLGVTIALFGLFCYRRQMIGIILSGITILVWSIAILFSMYSIEIEPIQRESQLSGLVPFEFREENIKALEFMSQNGVNIYFDRYDLLSSYKNAKTENNKETLKILEKLLK